MHPTFADCVAFDWLYPIALAWGLVNIAAFVGWGRAMGRWLVSDWGEKSPGWGLESSWGMATFLVLSGLMLVLSIFSTAFVTVFLLVGLFLAIWHSPRPGKKNQETFPPGVSLKAFFLSIALLTSLTYAMGVAAREYNCFDDFSAYFALAKMMLDTGTLHDPFNFRIVGTLGGQVALDTLVLAYFPWKFAHMVDFSIATLMMLGLVQSSIRGNDRRTWMARLLLMALAVTLPVPHVNVASEITGVVLFLTFFRSLDLFRKEGIPNWRPTILIGGIIAAASTLRAHNVFFLIALGVIYMVWRIWEDGPERRKTNSQQALLVALFAALFLAPWSWVGYRSCGVFLYPLVPGTHRPDFELYNHHLSFIETLQFIKGFFLSYNFLPLFIPLCFLQKGRERQQLWILGGTVLFMSAVFLSKLTFDLYFDIYRYLFPIGMAFGLYSASVLAQQLVAKVPDNITVFHRWRNRFVAAVAAYGLFYQSLHILVSIYVDINCVVDACKVGNVMWTDPHGIRNHPVYLESIDRDYRQAFSQIPPGSKVLISLDYPFLLNYQQHAIFNIDVAGAASPDPGFPYFQGAAHVKDYLRQQGICYIAHVPFDNSDSLHSRINQTLNFQSDNSIYHFFASYEKDFDDNVEELAKENPVVFDSPSIQVIDIQKGR